MIILVKDRFITLIARSLLHYIVFYTPIYNLYPYNILHKIKFPYLCLNSLPPLYRGGRALGHVGRVGALDDRLFEVECWRAVHDIHDAADTGVVFSTVVDVAVVPISLISAREICTLHERVSGRENVLV
jgi:hypothetical protein